MSRALLFFSSILLSIALLAQEKQKLDYLKFDYQLVVDNDAFTFDITKDQYYSSGIYASVRILLDSSKDKTKKIRTYQLNHRIYTPKWIGWEDISQLDRPYAGLLSASIVNEYYLKSSAYYKVNLELGILGPAALVGETQRTWHRWFGMAEPMGWKYQIENMPVANLHLTRIKPFYSSYHFELSSITNGSIGTVYNNIGQEIMIRLGTLRPLNQSAFTSASLGRKRSVERKSKTSEFYFFYAPAIEYVFQNATLQGSLFSENSPHQVDVIHWVWQHRVGVMWSWERFDLGLTSFWRSPENDEATKHNYVGIRLNQRF